MQTPSGAANQILVTITSVMTPIYVPMRTVKHHAIIRVRVYPVQPDMYVYLTGTSECISVLTVSIYILFLNWQYGIIMLVTFIFYSYTVFSGGSRISRWGGGGGGRRPPTWVLFGKNKRIRSCWGGGRVPAAPPGSANGIVSNCGPSLIVPSLIFQLRNVL